jgi:hypothetical protein
MIASALPQQADHPAVQINRRFSGGENEDWLVGGRWSMIDLHA